MESLAALPPVFQKAGKPLKPMSGKNSGGIIIKRLITKAEKIRIFSFNLCQNGIGNTFLKNGKNSEKTQIKFTKNTVT
jgi:hypothetical protein